jgi:hypothetical protein
MLKANFHITESGGTGIVQLQSSADAGATWQNVGGLLTLTNGTLTIDDSANIDIDTAVFTPGSTYEFRLIDHEGSPVSNVYSTHIPSITDYTAGLGTIDFVNSGGGDNWTVDFHAALTSYQSFTNAAPLNYECQVQFNAAGSQGNSPVTLDSLTAQTTDHTYHAASNGAGAYYLEAQYTFTNNETISVHGAVVVDGAGNIIASYFINGTLVNSASGLHVDLTAEVSAYNTSAAITWGAADVDYNFTSLGTGTRISADIPPDSIVVAYQPQLDQTVFADMQHDFFGGMIVVVT